MTLGGESRFLIELGEDNVDVYYLFDVVNAAAVPVTLPSPLVFEMPAGAQATTVLADSTPRATADGRRVTGDGGRSSLVALPVKGGLRPCLLG